MEASHIFFLIKESQLANGLRDAAIRMYLHASGVTFGGEGYNLGTYIPRYLPYLRTSFSYMTCQHQSFSAK